LFLAARIADGSLRALCVPKVKRWTTRSLREGDDRYRISWAEAGELGRRRKLHRLIMAGLAGVGWAAWVANKGICAKDAWRKSLCLSTFW
jgi:hypothetical protein